MSRDSDIAWLTRPRGARNSSDSMIERDIVRTLEERSLKMDFGNAEHR
jgi:hypothetical protein